jgi:hypothetical protein
MRIFLVFVVSLLAEGLAAAAAAATGRRDVSAISTFSQLGLNNLAAAIQKYNISLSAPIDNVPGFSGSFSKCSILVRD